MANPTNPFNWQMPQSTDLVTDLPADFETFGQAVATSMADLLGGTTGQVLSKASNTDMDFTWVAQDDSNAIQNAIVDAKGDLIAASAADTPARLAVGANGDSLFPDSSTSTGLRWQASFPAGKNKIINGDFGIWQRGTSFTLNSTGGYTADRYEASSGGGGVAVFSRQTFTPGTDPVNGYAGTYYLDANYTTSGTSTILLENKMEDVTTFANQPITFSFWGKVSTGTHVLSPEVVQRFGTGGSSAVVTSASSNVTLTTSWARYSVTFSVPAITGKTVGAGSSTSVRLNIGTSGVKTFSIWGWQAEYGSVATAFQTATGTIQGELAACQRYLPSVMAAGNTWLGYATATNNSYTQVSYPVQARVAPTGISVPSLAGNFTLFAASGGSGTPTAINFDSAGVNSALIQVITTVGSPTLAAGTTTALRGASGSSYILFTGCEL
jgi:hypothetical protein